MNPNTNWPEGVSINIATWHFHRRLYERYGQVLYPGEFSYIVREIDSGRLMPLKNIFTAERSRLQIYCYRRPHATTPRLLYILANPISLHLVSVYPEAWITKRIMKKSKNRS